jgi:FkbM family methyltransferase
MGVIRVCIFWVFAKLAIQVGLNSSNVSKKSIKRMIKKSSNLTILDVGANVGDFSKLCRDVFKNVTLFAIEPQVVCHDDIRFKCGPDIIIIGKALSSKPGINPFEITKAKDRKAHLMSNLKQLDLDQGIECETTTVDDLIKEYKLERIDLLKIDTEGHDFEVIKGARNGLASGKIQIILFEIIPRLLLSGSMPSDVEFFLRSYGFNFFYRSTPNLGLLKLKKLSDFELHTQNIVASKTQIR